MLQPTSCGPGPPTTRTKTRKKQQLQEQLRPEQQHRQQQQQQQQHQLLPALTAKNLSNCKTKNIARETKAKSINEAAGSGKVANDTGSNTDDDDDETSNKNNNNNYNGNDVISGNVIAAITAITSTTTTTTLLPPLIPQKQANNEYAMHWMEIGIAGVDACANAMKQISSTTQNDASLPVKEEKASQHTAASNNIQPSISNSTRNCHLQKCYNKIYLLTNLLIVILTTMSGNIYNYFAAASSNSSSKATATGRARTTSSAFINKFFCTDFKLKPKLQKLVNFLQIHKKSQRSGNSMATTSFVSSSLASMPATTTSKWFIILMLGFNIMAQIPQQVAAEKSKHYYMQSLCKNHFLQQLYRKIDGAVLWSQNERNLDCIITFQTHSILQRFMLRFDMLQLDCNDHLYIYDGAHAVATPKIDISCRQTKQTVSSILTRTNFVTLKYVTDNWGTDANGFKLVITSVKDPKHTCKDFTCGSNGFCIHPDLLCDGINHCSDNSDESVHNLCQSETASTIFGMDMTWFVMIVVSILLILSAAIVGITICVCRRQEDANQQQHQNTSIQLHHAAETNGSSKHLHYTHAVGGTLTREHTQLPPTSGNSHHPAGPYTGYHSIQHNYLKMATKVRPIWCLANFVNWVKI